MEEAYLIERAGKAPKKINIFAKTREKPQRVGFIFLLAISEISGKKPHPPGAFAEIPPYLVTYEFCAYK